MTAATGLLAWTLKVRLKLPLAKLSDAGEELHLVVCALVSGSPKRRPFQRQRAASETTDHTEDESSPVGEELVGSITLAPLQALSAESLSHRWASSHDAA